MKQSPARMYLNARVKRNSSPLAMLHYRICKRINDNYVERFSYCPSADWAWDGRND